MNKSFAWSARALLAAGLLISAPAFAQEVAEPAQEVAEPPAVAEEDVQVIPLEAAEDVEDALVSDTIVEDPDADESKKAWSLSAGLGMNVGQGTFMTAKNDTEWSDEVVSPDNAYDRVSVSLSVSAGYKLSDFNFGVNVGANQWLSEGGGSNAVQEFRLRDVSLNAGWKGYEFGETGIRFTPGLAATLPTSTASRFQTLLFDTSLSLGLSKTFFKKVSISYGLSGTVNFHRYTTPTFPLDAPGIENVLYRAGELVSPTHVSVGGRNSQYALGNSFSVSVPIWTTLRLSASYGIHAYWSYAGEDTNADEFMSDIACEGRCAGQMSTGGLSLSYGINDWLSVRAGLSSAQPPKTADNKSFRFPFWNFTGAAANRSSFSFGVSGSY